MVLSTVIKVSLWTSTTFYRTIHRSLGRRVRPCHEVGVRLRTVSPCVGYNYFIYKSFVLFDSKSFSIIILQKSLVQNQLGRTTVKDLLLFTCHSSGHLYTSTCTKLFMLVYLSTVENDRDRKIFDM